MKCPKGKIVNHMTKRCVLKNGQVARKLKLSPKKQLSPRPKYKKALKGGMFINSGTYGVVISPAIPCNREELQLEPDYLNSFVSKIITNPQIDDNYQSYKNETNPALLEILNRIDPNQKEYIRALPSQPCQDIQLTELRAETRDDIQKYFPGITSTGQLLFFRMNKINISTGSKLTRGQLDVIEQSLRKLHANGIVHNDFHSENAVQLENGQVRIIDFGRSKLQDQYPYEDKDAEETFTFANRIRNDLERLEAVRSAPPPAPSRKQARREDESRRREESSDSSDEEGNPPKVSRLF